MVPLRGNVHTRLRKLADGEVAATLLALAGLTRLGLSGTGSVIEPEEMLPAVGQGAIGITCRIDDASSKALLALLDHAPTAAEVTAERAMLAVLDGTCHTPIAGLGRASGDDFRLRGLVAWPDGSRLLDGDRSRQPCRCRSDGTRSRRRAAGSRRTGVLRHAGRQRWPMSVPSGCG